MLFFFCDSASGEALIVVCFAICTGEVGVPDSDPDSGASECSVASGVPDVVWAAEYWVLPSSPVNEMVIAIAIRARFSGMNKTSYFGMVTQVLAWFYLVSRLVLVSVEPSQQVGQFSFAMASHGSGFQIAHGLVFLDVYGSDDVLSAGIWHIATSGNISDIVSFRS